jgi:hypothetical protein
LIDGRQNDHSVDDGEDDHKYEQLLLLVGLVKDHDSIVADYDAGVGKITQI